MNFPELLNALVNETTGLSLGLFTPELSLCVTIVGLLLVRLFGLDRWLPSYWLALVGALVAFGFTYFQFSEMKSLADPVPQEFFTGLLVYDKFAVFLRLFLLLFLVLVIALTVLSGIPDNEDGPDFYTLLLGSTIGMMLMASANNLLILFLGIEMTSVPSYAMVGFLKGRRLSSEAALKYVVYGAGAAGVMLYGISLISGLLGTADFAEIGARVQTLMAGAETGGTGMSTAMVRTLVLATLMVLVGIAFKLSLVPFHFWCPDAFEGASAEVAGFLSVASKAAAFALLVRFCLAVIGTDPGTLSAVNLQLGIGLGVVASVTATFGNLAAYTQNNLKRLLAYSTIAHAGYMLMAVAAMLIFKSGGETAGLSAAEVHLQSARCLEGLLYYLSVYLFMNLGAFAVVAMIRNQIFSEDLNDYKGLGWESPLLSVCMMVCLLSLIGLPPLGGFIGKFMIFKSLYDAGHVHWSMWLVLVVGGANTVFGLFYYLRVLKTMYLEERLPGARPVDVPFMPVGAYVVMVSIPVLALGVFVGPLSYQANEVARVLLK